MAAYQFAAPSQVFLNLEGTAPAGGGYVQFYDIGTTDPKTTYSEQAMGMGSENANPVPLSSDGRLSVEVWLDGDYSWLLYEADDTLVETGDAVPEIAPGLAIPSLTGNGGKVLTNDETNLLWEDRLNLPDPSGSGGQMVVANADGDAFILQAVPEPDPPIEPDIEVAAGSLIVGDGVAATKSRFLSGSATGTNSGTRFQSVTVAFAADSFSGTPTYLEVSLTGATAYSVSGNNPSPRITAKSSTGFTVQWTMGELDDTQSQYNFNAGVTFDWLAFGPYVAP
jgi:hypothetical protein